MQAMADWYMKGDQDQARLSRILDVAQDLKVVYNINDPFTHRVQMLNQLKCRQMQV